MPTVDCDPDDAADRLRAAGVDIEPGNTDHEQWRAERDGAVAVAYDDKVVVQGSDPGSLTMLLQDGGGRAHVYFDGASRGNPGPAAVGWVLVTSDGIAADGNARIGETTNNDAEYQALIRALEAARDYGLDEVDVRGDSELIVKQVRGEWNTNEPTLRERRV
ncbi:MAG: ribonuclease HI family protein, partial [Halohasta sp.]